MYIYLSIEKEKVNNSNIKGNISAEKYVPSTFKERSTNKFQELFPNA